MWYHYFTPVYKKSQWYDLQFLRYRAWQTNISNFRSFFTLLSPKNQNNQNFEKIPGNIIIFQMSTKIHCDMIYGSRETVRQTQFSVILVHILPFFTPLNNHPKNQNFEKNEKKTTWRYNHCTHLYQKWESYDVWLLRYKALQEELLVILAHFLLFYPPPLP